MARPAPSPTRSARKRAAILAAAAESFREEGILAASMDRSAERAGVSKRTVYNHFSSKEALFDVVVAEAWARLVPHEELPRAGDSVDERLKALARQRLDSLLEPELLGLFRSVLAESIRTPELGRAYRDQQRLHLLGLEALLREEAARGRLRIENLELAASHFWGLVLESLFWPVVLGLRAPAPPADRARVVNAGVAVFLAHYGAPDAARPVARARRR